MKTKKETILENLRKIKGICDFEIIAETEKKALKKSRLDGVATPDNLALITKVTLATVSLGNDYETEVNKKLKEDGEKPDFKRKEGASYARPISALETGIMGAIEKLLSVLGISLKDRASKIIYKHKENDQFYIRVYPELAKDYTSYSIYFDKNGAEITSKEYEELEKAYFPEKKEARIEVRNYKLENIIYLGDGDRVLINELDDELLKKLA